MILCRMITARMFGSISFLLAFPLACSASYLYDVTTYDFDLQQYEYSFTLPNLLLSTGTFTPPALTILIPPPNGCVVTSVTLHDPMSAGAGLVDTFTNCNFIASSVGLPGPIDHDGTYSNGAQFPTILTLSGAASPEPGSVWILGTGLIAFGLISKRFAGN